MNTIKSIVSGSVIKIHVGPGQNVQPGDVIVTVESMKMEIPVEAEEAGTIGEILVSEGQPVSEEDDVATYA
ncbi:acetyl-CoA carboxylase biotin carboxyl carrier protein subunit [Achromobacter sp. Marseille-Q4962]|uniref:acetyl-CoA carboxylase biotin carboxyl carrier protein subunit n=1 Tax=Achromobacter sp. Marseille-Q4962 TaxID=2942202 RepID=UPI0020737642|nr:acetyl-CoA carboxylase biotin carboxyl carrier protein subunit [Achromobacter sp. Marseille-Q4962]